MALCVSELFPHDDYRKCQEHRIEYADGGKLEAGDLVVRSKPFQGQATANQGRPAHRQQGRKYDKQYRGKPQWKEGQNHGYVCVCPTSSATVAEFPESEEPR
jgi:hypothetical protein